MGSVPERKRIGSFEQIGAVFNRLNTRSQPVVRSITIHLSEEQSQRFDAAQKRYGGRLSPEKFASLAMEAGLPKLMEQS